MISPLTAERVKATSKYAARLLSSPSACFYNPAGPVVRLKRQTSNDVKKMKSAGSQQQDAKKEFN